ncbi:hypothetical protein FQN57_007431 [Myotisia sp. PD_48]|nr:hypothetical protein FQN57_007431 [Myotisia sp. PD_48]
MQEETSLDGGFPWELGVFDAHCHPTDTLSSIDEIEAMRATALTIMATRAQDQELVCQVASRYQQKSGNLGYGRIIPSFGWHPWFSHQVFDDTTMSQAVNQDYLSSIKVEHYKSALSPLIKDEAEDDHFLHELPVPWSLRSLLDQTRERLLRYPHALVGEIGIDKAFRIPKAWGPDSNQANKEGASASESPQRTRTPGTREGRALSPYRVKLSHQRAVLKAQLLLAGELQRPVSLHSVQAHGAILETLCSLWKGYERKIPSKRQQKISKSVPQAGERKGEPQNDSTRYLEGNSSQSTTQSLPFPPRVCMHSYSGPVEQLSQFLHPTVPAEIYFSFSSVISFPDGMNTKSYAVVKALPDDRILVESDLHRAGPEMDDMLERAVRNICDIRGWPLDEGIRILGDNWRRFVFG